MMLLHVTLHLSYSCHFLCSNYLYLGSTVGSFYLQLVIDGIRSRKGNKAVTKRSEIQFSESGETGTL